MFGDASFGARLMPRAVVNGPAAVEYTEFEEPTQMDEPQWNGRPASGAYA